LSKSQSLRTHGIVSLRLDPEVFQIPDSWADYRHQRAGGSESTRWYAVLTRSGKRELVGTTEDSGVSIDGKWELGLQVLYIREDAGAAFERWYSSTTDDEGRPLPQRDEYFSSLVLPEDYSTASEIAPEDREQAADLLRTTHGIEVDIPEGSR